MMVIKFKNILLRISEKAAGWTLLVGFFLLASAHVLVLVGVIDGELFWGGRISDEAELRRSEWFALLITCMFAMPVLIRMGWLGNRPKSARAGLWLLVIYMVLNAAGNTLAISWQEKLFAIPALILAICAWRLTFFTNSDAPTG